MALVQLPVRVPRQLRYPADTAEEDRQLDYTFGLDRILDGVATLIRQRTG
ncbi:hypothetical protein ACIA5G_17565 [Amycolatopsis sp. NPDC051758]